MSVAAAATQLWSRCARCTHHPIIDGGSASAGAIINAGGSASAASSINDGGSASLDGLGPAVLKAVKDQQYQVPYVQEVC